MKYKVINKTHSISREKPEGGQFPRLPPVHLLLKWNNVAHQFPDTVDKIDESEVNVVRGYAKSTNCRSRMHV